MKSLIKSIILLLITVFTVNSYSQVNVKINTKAFKNKELVSGIKEADTYFKNANSISYNLAIQGYYHAYEYTQNNAELNYKLGICYLYSQEKNRATTILQQAYSVNPNVAPDINYFLGNAYQKSGNFDEAVKQYELFENLQKDLKGKKQSQLFKEVAKRKDECKNAKRMTENPIRVWIDNLGPNINSNFPEYGSIFPIDESFIIFTSRRDYTGGGKRNELDPNDNQYYEDIYVSYRNDKKTFDKAINLSKLNSMQHDASISISPDGQTLFTYKGFDAGTILECKLDGKEWDTPKAIKAINTSKYQETSASLSNDGKTLYFVSDRPKDDFGNESIGGLDIFYVEKNEKGKWGKVKNIGLPINSKYDEEGIFIHADNRTLYFSSKRDGSMGGYDIYTSEKDDNDKWQEPENIGYPVNTVDDDIFFVPTANPRYAYFSSVREGGLGSYDIYKITFLGPDKLMAVGTEDFLIATSNSTIEQKVKLEEVEVKKIRLTIMKGTVTDALSQEPIAAVIELIDTATGKIINTIKTNKFDGSYLVSFPTGSAFNFVVSAPSFTTYEEEIEMPESSAYQEVTKDFVLTKAGIGSKIVLSNIEFDLAKATLRPSSYPELDRLVKLLKAYPRMEIEIGGHTDNTGTLAINQKLSTERAKSVVDYLIENGIRASRLSYTGYADKQPIADNNTEQGRQLNRRVEFKVISIK